ncbi:DUF2306 domain-containing protein [Cohnella sp. AR92]|uniref:DUF2306 domain-containing protein n=1 Tax=Cohnella sp. AR92 TaxID=648716 RepID=UPI00131572BC|nr:DUF2306 domain-containing protein [Cohnella sp. AR92]
MKFGFLALLAIGVGAYAWMVYGNPSKVGEQSFVIEKGALPDLWSKALWAHAVSAGFAIAIGWLQFLGRLRRRAPALHRIIGYAYSLGIAIAGVSALYLAVYADGGPSGKLGFGMLALLWLFTLVQGLRSIIVYRDSKRHGRWMIRNYALTCAAISLRLYTLLSAALFGLSDTNDTFVVISWLCWLPNLLLAEAWVRRRSHVF